MPPKMRISKQKKWKLAGEVRRSQVVGTYGPGAIVDFPRLSGIMAGLEEWNIHDGSLPAEARFTERNLQKMLGKDFFIQVSTDENTDSPFRLPVYRFPSYYYCPECHMLDRYKVISKTIGKDSELNKILYCSNSKCQKNGKPIRLIPSRFIAACRNGHISDFPYFEWVHHRSASKDPDARHQLFLKYDGDTGGLDSIKISCTCGAVINMSGSMDKEALSFLNCSCTMPWLGFDAENKPWYKDPNGCMAKMRTMQRSANNVYYPVTQSALTIPPWSSKVQQVIKRHQDTLEDIFEEDEEDIIRRLKKHYSKYSKEYKCSEKTFIAEAYRYFRDSDETEITEAVLREGEYNAFCDVDRNEPSDFFCTRSSDVPEELLPYLESIKIVSRLREVKVLKGFRRIIPSFETDPEKRREEGLNDIDFAPLSKQPLEWLPAIQMFGEGIFIKFKEQAICEWEKKNANYYMHIGERLDTPSIGNYMFDVNKPRYILLHTIAHLLIRQLTVQCGYVSASLREKIYSTFPDSSESMCGVLIYTSSTDSDGSLGGLAREGEGIRLGNMLLSALEEATWCSNDPICIDSKGQGYKGLNLAACHACTLLPETSCEANNCLLDRASVVGTPENRAIGYFAGILE